MRAFEFVADAPGDWAIHCHKSHHTMNAMGHDVKTYIGVNMNKTAPALKKIAPGYMPMGGAGMGEMGSMEMPLPDNTLPMMTGFAQFGPVEMGGMFSVVKVRPGLAADDYKDPGWYKHPEGTVAYEWKGEKLAEPARATSPDSGVKATEFKAIDPRKRPVRSAGSGGHGNH
jgi:hypothetical protein